MIKKKFANYLNKTGFKPDQKYLDRFILGFYDIYRRCKGIFLSSDSKIFSKLYLQTRYLKRKRFGGSLSFVSLEDLVVWTNQWIPKLPKNFDVIVGIPRSGLLIANIIAVRLGKSLTTPDLFCQEVFWLSKRIPDQFDKGKILLVDDSIDSGQSMAEAYLKVKSAAPGSTITTAALIVTPESLSQVDCYYKIIPHPRLFEWNLLHAKKGVLVSDLDGVLAENCPPGYDRNENLYLKWLEDAKPYIIPCFTVDTILSCRLEKYRAQTEAWLAKHGIRYHELILWDLDCKSQRQGQNAQFKINHILRIKPDLIWESSYHEAQEIWEKTKVPTLCFDEMVLFA